MIYSKKTPWTLILGIIMVAFGYMVQAGVLDPMVKYLHLSKFVGKSGAWGEMVMLPFVFGIIAIVVGLWQLAIKPKEGNADYYFSTVGGVTFIMLIGFIVKWGLDPLMAVWGKAAEESMKAAQLTWAFDFAKVMNLNYVVMGIVAGIIVVNVFRVPSWAENGVRLSRMGLKTGVVLLGVLYSWQDLHELLGLSIVMIGVFVLGRSAWCCGWVRVARSPTPWPVYFPPAWACVVSRPRWPPPRWLTPNPQKSLTPSAPCCCGAC